MMKHDKKFYEEMDSLFNAYLNGEDDTDTFCETKCPLYGKCHNDGRCFACGVWEDKQSDDL